MIGAGERFVFLGGGGLRTKIKSIFWTFGLIAVTLAGLGASRSGPGAAAPLPAASVGNNFWRGWRKAAVPEAKPLPSCAHGREFPNVFCTEGFFYRRFQAAPLATLFALAALPEAEIPRLPPLYDRQARAVWLTALGMAIAERGSSFPSPFPPRETFAHVIDGWGFRTYQLTGSAASAKGCESFASGRLKDFCDFGRGRASFFSEPFARAEEDAESAGRNFAEAFTGRLIPDQTSSPTAKIGYLLESLWAGRADYSAGLKPLYDCLARRHLLDCVERVPKNYPGLHP